MSDEDKFTILESPMKRDEANMDKNNAYSYKAQANGFR